MHISNEYLDVQIRVHTVCLLKCLGELKTNVCSTTTSKVYEQDMESMATN